MNDDFKEFIRRYFKRQGIPFAEPDVEALQGDGSTRAFFRVRPSVQGLSVIAMENPPTDRKLDRENIAYLKIGRHLHGKGVPIPDIYQCDLERGWFIMEDMGCTSLQDLVLSGKDPVSVYERVLEHLFQLQVDGVIGFKVSWCCQTERYDRAVMGQYESGYFKRAFLHLYLGLKEAWPELDASFDHLAENASLADCDTFMHRDFQSRNIMISKDKIGIIDWQGGRLGPMGYDLASLLIDPYIGLSTEQRDEIYEMYLRRLSVYRTGWVTPFRRYYPFLAIQRNLQILGAFSYLTIIQKKQHFEIYIPRAIRTLQDLLHQVEDAALSPLTDLADKL